MHNILCYFIGPFTRVEEKEAVTFAMQNLVKIRGKFSMLLTSVCTNLRQKGISSEDFRLFVVALLPLSDCVPKSSDLSEIFEAITRNRLWDYWNYSPLQSIVEKFGGSEMMSMIQEYRKDLSGFLAATKIGDYIPAIISLDAEELEQPTSPWTDSRYYRQLSLKSHRTHLPIT